MDQSYEARLAELEIRFRVLGIVTMGALALLESCCNGKKIEIEEVRTLAKALEPLLEAER